MAENERTSGKILVVSAVVLLGLVVALALSLRNAAQEHLPDAARSDDVTHLEPGPDTTADASAGAAVPRPPTIRPGPDGGGGPEGFTATPGARRDASTTLVLNPASMKMLQATVRGTARHCFERLPAERTGARVSVSFEATSAAGYINAAEPQVKFHGVEAPEDVVTCVTDATRGLSIPAPVGQGEGVAVISFSVTL